MLRVFELIGGFRNEILPSNGLFTVHELGNYQFEYSHAKIRSNIFFIEDECISVNHIKSVTDTTIVTLPYKYFEDYFGFARVIVNDESYQFNILGEKFDISEIQEIIMFLYNKDHSTLNTFISKSSIGASKIYEGREYLYSSKYLNLISHTLDTFNELAGTFSAIPHTVVRKKIELSDYSSDVGDYKSIEWLFQNLDTIDFEYSYKNHPDGICFDFNFGIADKIGVEKSTPSFDTYENGIVLGVFESIKVSLDDIESLIKNRLDETQKEVRAESMKYIDFRDLKKVPFIKFLQTVNLLKVRLAKISYKYASIFHDAKVINKYPKLSPVFYRYRHYQRAYSAICEFRSSKYSVEGEIQLLNIKKLSELYELFNLHCIIDCFDQYLLKSQYEKIVQREMDNDRLDFVSYSSFDHSVRIRIFNNPKITISSDKFKLITIGNVYLTGSYCRPDFVLEFEKGGIVKYYILDAKYSKYSTVINQYLGQCIKKYIIDIGIENSPYQKPDFLILLHPDSKDPGGRFIHGQNYYPQIATMISKPTNLSGIHDFINEIIEKIFIN